MTDTNTKSLTLKFSLVSHGSDYDNVLIPSVTKLATERIKYDGKCMEQRNKHPPTRTLTVGFQRLVLTVTPAS